MQWTLNNITGYIYFAYLFIVLNIKTCFIVGGGI